MLEIVLFEPEIPPNTGNAIRLCANAGCRMHLVHPLGFSLRDKLLQRAGLDYRDFAEIVQHEDWRACRSALDGRRLFAVTTRGARRYDAPRYREGDVFVFGPETRGLPAEVLGACRTCDATSSLCKTGQPNVRSKTTFSAANREESACLCCD